MVIAAQITERQTRILNLVAQGLDQPEIAAQLHLGVATVKATLRQLYDILGARNAPHAVSLAYQRGLLRVDRVCCRAHLAAWLDAAAYEVRKGQQ